MHVRSIFVNVPRTRYIREGKKRTKLKEIFEPIRDHYTFCLPCDTLENHIEFFSESIINDREFTVEMFPSWTPTMYINLGNPYCISLNGLPYAIDKDSDILVLRDLHTIRHNLPGDRIFTIKFKPGGLQSVLGISQLHLKQKIVQLNQVLPVPVLAQIKSCSEFDARKKIIEEYFIRKQARKKADHYVTFVQDLVGTYKQTGGQINVTQLAEKHFVTSKTVNRYFHRVIGTSPKEYFFLLRARTALTAYAGNRAGFDPCAFGYYDNSHFYKEAARFTGRSLRLM